MTKDTTKEIGEMTLDELLDKAISLALEGNAEGATAFAIVAMARTFEAADKNEREVSMARIYATFALIEIVNLEDAAVRAQGFATLAQVEATLAVAKRQGAQVEELKLHRGELVQLSRHLRGIPR